MKMTSVLEKVKEVNPAAYPFVSAALQLARAIDDVHDGEANSVDLSNRFMNLLALAWGDEWALTRRTTLFPLIHASFAKWIASNVSEKRAVRNVLKEVAGLDIVAYALSERLTPLEVAQVFVDYPYELE